MKEQFVDFETAKMLKGLGFKEKCFAVIDSGGIVYRDDKPINTPTEHVTAPLWQQVEDWLWHNQNIIIEVVDVSTEAEDEEPGIEEFEVSVKQKKDFIQITQRDCPILAKNEGIRAAVKHLYDQHLNSK